MISCIASRKIIQTEAIMREKLTFFFVISTICLIFAIELVNKETFCQLVRGNQVKILNCTCSCKPLFMGQAHVSATDGLHGDAMQELKVKN